VAFSISTLEPLCQKLDRDSEIHGLDAQASRAERRARGAFFTPQPLVEFVARWTLQAWISVKGLEWPLGAAPQLRILDPAAGDGRFLQCAAEVLLQHGLREGKVSSANILEARQLIYRDCLIGIEREPRYAEHIRLSLPEIKLFCEEALLSRVVPDGSVDIVLSNPPYLRSIQLGASDAALRSKLRGASQWARFLRASLSESGAIHGLVDFGARQLFEGATVYSSLCFASASKSKQVAVARHRSGNWSVGHLENSQLGEGPWNLAVGPGRAFLERVCRQGPTLGSVARIAKGAGTNADSVFVIQNEEEAKQAGLEDEILWPVFRGRDVVSFGKHKEWPKVLVPYDVEGRLFTPERMRELYPNAFDYLLEHRNVLEKRERGRFAGPTFYCFGRPQNLNFHRAKEKKIIIPDVAKEGRAQIDCQGAMVLDSAYAIRLQGEAHPDIALEGICAVLNSRIVSIWLGHQGVPLRGGYTRMKTAFLNSLPLPPQGELATLSELVKAGADCRVIDEGVRQAYGARVGEWTEL
jgi:hypothetical protein